MLFITLIKQRRGGQKWSANRQHFSLKTISVFISLILGLFMTQVATAQCTMVCNGANINTPNNASLDENCEAIITADAILEGSSCPGPKTLQLMTTNGVLVATGLETITIDGFYVDQTMEIKVIDNNTGNSCWGYLLIQDNFAPELSCTNLSLVCSAPIHPDSIGYPAIMENCDNEVDLFYTDAVVNNDCDPAISARITRTWTATDDSGNVGTCSQIITMTRPDINDVVFPADVNFSCENPNADPSMTGLPTLDGRTLSNNDFCEISMDYEDLRTFICGTASFQIVREFTIVDHCMASNNIRRGSQIIRFLDNEAPVINCQPTLNVGTDLNNCTATITLPTPPTTDNCSNFNISVVTSYGGQGFGPHFGVPTGSHTVTYRATDNCSNVSTCVTTLRVADQQVPSVACDDRLIVSLTSAGVAALQATSINDNSHDNCTTQLDYLAARMDNLVAGFGSLVTFNCSDVGQSVMVILRVRETNNPSLFSECMVEVEVQDKIPAFIDCPDNLTIDCEIDYSNLSIFGEVEVFDACGTNVTSNSNLNINNCGTGTILRTFTATDPSGNSRSCTQTIQVQNNTPFSANDIRWPLDYTTSDCNPSLEPGNLPSGTLNYSTPIILSETCGLIAATHSDEVFTIAGQACIKILRRWKVIDWCEYDPAFPNQGGIFEHLQVIKVIDQNAPTIQCPNNVVAAVNNNCTSGLAIVPGVTATDCSTSLSITNNSPFASQSGSNASGTYPLGITPVRFTATDGCGNSTTCTITVTIEDQKAPTPLCIQGLSVNLMSMNGGGMIMVPADIFNAGSSDNCTSANNLVFTIERSEANPDGLIVPSTTEIMYTCGDVGMQEVKVWATDRVGNSAFCETFIDIQANSGVCGNVRPYISGATRTAQAQDVQGVAVRIQTVDNSFTDTTYTAGDGVYMLQDIALQQTYQITPMKNIQPLNGVSTLDLILISKHVLGVNNLNSPYKIIAADVNGSGAVTTADIIALRKLILQLTNGFDHNTSWRFVDAAYEFSDPTNPFLDDFPEQIILQNLQNSSVENQFVAIKIGDVNGSAIPNNLSDEVDNRNHESPFVLNMSDEWLVAGEAYQLKVTAKEIADLLGCQFTLNFDETMVEITDIQVVHEAASATTSFAWAQVADGKITVSWAIPNLLSIVDENHALFQIQLNTKRATSLKEVLRVSSDLTAAEAYNSQLERRNVNLEFTEAATIVQQHGTFELFQNRPNPFQNETTIRFQLPKATSTNLRIYDVSGKVIYQADYELAAGYNEINLSGQELPVSGILYYQLKTETDMATMKMFKL